MASNYTPEEVTQIKELLQAPGWKTLEKVLKEKRDAYYMELHSALTDHRYKQGKLHGIEELWKRIFQLAQTETVAHEIDEATSIEQSWINRVGRRSDVAEPEPSMAGWIK